MPITNFMLCGDIVWTTCIYRGDIVFFYFYYFYFCCFSPSHYIQRIYNCKYNKQTGKLYLQPAIRITENVWLSEKSFLIAGVIILYLYIFLLLLFGVKQMNAMGHPL